MTDKIDREAVKKELLKLIPAPEQLREIPARIPFTTEEWETIRKGRIFAEPDDKWLFCPEGDSLLIFRHVPDGTWFFWKICFEPDEGAYLMSKVVTDKSNTTGKAFASDRNQMGYSWWLIDMLVLKREVGAVERYCEAAKKLSKEPPESTPARLLELKSKLIA